MRAILTPDDLKKGDLVEPGWYKAEITEYREDEAETDGSTNCKFFFKIFDHPKYSGVSPQKLFNEKALGFGKSLWKTLGLPYDEKKGYEITTELLQAQVGKKLQVYIVRGKSNKGNEFNDLKDFRPL